MTCGSSWMVYYKMFDFNTKNLNITDTPIEDEIRININKDGIFEDKQDSSDQVEIDPSLLQEIPCTVVTDDGTKLRIETTDNN